MALRLVTQTAVMLVNQMAWLLVTPLGIQLASPSANLSVEPSANQLENVLVPKSGLWTGCVSVMVTVPPMVLL